ncbi:hypothetical protein F5Y13DRAFT_158512 [Hypoxylon sp. FL1857]|nr:hypothetical protein F5Y13DRAFT_158512 [Hypoxylon sp. FL1857]
MSVSVISSGILQFCNLCSKPIATESAYKRHIAYCRRTQGRIRKRRRSCKECHSAKAKCSFEPECSRCKSKGLYCVYETPGISIHTAKESLHHDSASSSTGDSPRTMELHDPSMCSSPLTNFGASTSLPLPETSPRSIVALRADPVARHSARFILESMRGLPLTMISRETFSWFNHGHWYQSELPLNLARCIEIANLYIDRKSLGEDSFWSVITQENRRLLRVLPNSSLDELLSGMQVQIAYMIMLALGNTSMDEIPEVTLSLLMTFDLYGNRCNKIDENVWFPPDRLDDPSETWENWVLAETRRRCTITWFLLSRVMDLKFGVMCPSISNCRTLPLPAPGSLWNARTRAGWEAARRVHCQTRPVSLRTFRDLIEARSCPPGSERGQELNRWHANCDKLGLLLTLATTMI